MEYIYGITVLLATTLGAIAGIGGGVIIKPVFDIFKFHDTATISFYSSLIVLSMSTISIFKLIKKGVKFQRNIISYISLGSIIGGIFGENLLNTYISSMAFSKDLSYLQNELLLISLILILLYSIFNSKFRTFKIRSNISIFTIGFILGIISIFLGIGGGPLNILLLTLFFSYDQRESACYSIGIIFFAQISKLLTIILRGDICKYEISILPILCILAVIGGYVGTHLNRSLKLSSIKKIYISTLIGLVLVCINIII